MSEKPPSKNLTIRNSTAEFLIFTNQVGKGGIEVRYEEESIWLTQKLMAELFDVDKRTVSEHLKNIFSSNELEEKSVVRNFRTTSEGVRSAIRKSRITESYAVAVKKRGKKKDA